MAKVTATRSGDLVCVTWSYADGVTRTYYYVLEGWTSDEVQEFMDQIHDLTKTGEVIGG